MFSQVIDSIRTIFDSPLKRLEMKTRGLAAQTTQNFDNLQKIIKDSEYERTDQQKVIDDREQFLMDNTNNQVDQNVSKNEDNKRAYMLLTGIMLIGCILSVKGLKFFFGEFYASISLLMIIPVALILAGVIVVGSIYLNNFANRFRNENPFVFIQLKTAAYAMVLFIPSMNLLEGFDSNYRPVVMALNVVGCVIDVILHTSLVSMSSVFITAEDSRKAIKIMQIKDKTLSAADQKIRAFNGTFMKAKTSFTSTAKQLVSSFKELQALSADAASNALFLLDNFTIWMLNNKVMQHAIIPYHADENGHPIVELNFFTPEQDTIRLAWDNLSMVKMEITNGQSAESVNRTRLVTKITEGNVTHQPIQEQPPAVNIVQPPNDNDHFENLPSDYDAILDNVNQNDKIL